MLFILRFSEFPVFFLPETEQEHAPHPQFQEQNPGPHVPSASTLLLNHSLSFVLSGGGGVSLAVQAGLEHIWT